MTSKRKCKINFITMKTLSKIERWRREMGWSQRKVAGDIGASDAVVVAAEAGRPIRRVYIDAYIRLSEGFLTRDDFIEAQSPGRKKANGKKIKG